MSCYNEILMGKEDKESKRKNQRERKEEGKKEKET